MWTPSCFQQGVIYCLNTQSHSGPDQEVVDEQIKQLVLTYVPGTKLSWLPHAQCCSKLPQWSFELSWSSRALLHHGCHEHSIRPVPTGLCLRAGMRGDASARPCRWGGCERGRGELAEAATAGHGKLRQAVNPPVAVENTRKRSSTLCSSGLRCQHCLGLCQPAQPSLVRQHHRQPANRGGSGGWKLGRALPVGTVMCPNPVPITPLLVCLHVSALPAAIGLAGPWLC